MRGFFCPGEAGSSMWRRSQSPTSHGHSWRTDVTRNSGPCRCRHGIALLFGAMFWSPGAAKNQPTSYIIRKTGFLFWKKIGCRNMLSPAVFRMVLEAERDIVDVSRKIERLRLYVERAEAEGGDASYSRQALYFMQSALSVLCEQRDHAAMAIRQTNKALTAASEMPPLPAMLQAPDVVGSALGVSPVGQPPTSDGCSQSLLI